MLSVSAVPLEDYSVYGVDETRREAIITRFTAWADEVGATADSGIVTRGNISQTGVI